MTTKQIQITAGRGPVECCWVVAQTLKRFVEALKNANITYEILHRESGSEPGTIQSVILSIEGKELELFLEDWLGAIQWIGTSKYRKFHKRKNWFIALQELQGNRTIALQLNEVKFQAIRSSGPGGQHANKVSSAVRATHIKSGLQVLAMDHRSQHQNKKLALQRLQEKVQAYNQNQWKQEVQAQWQQHLSIQRGNPVRVFTGPKFQLK